MDDKNTVQNQNNDVKTDSVSAVSSTPANAVAAEPKTDGTPATTTPQVFGDKSDGASVTEQPKVAPAPTNDTSSSDLFAQFAERIINEQESIIGPIAREQATKVQGLKIDPVTKKVILEGNKKTILENLVRQYELLFGRVSIEICREAVRGIVSSAPTDQVPQILL